MEQNVANLPVLALRGMTIFPNMLMHFDVERAMSIHALEKAMEGNQDIFLVSQREIAVDTPSEKDMYDIGTVSHIRQILRVSDSDVRVMIEGNTRARMLGLLSSDQYLYATVELLSEPKAPAKPGLKAEALLRQCYGTFGDYHEVAPKMTTEVLANVLSCRDPGYLADYIAQNTGLRHEDKQVILDELNPLKRLEKLNGILARELEVLLLEQDLDGKVRERMAKIQKDYVLREQMKVLKEELGEGDNDAEASEYEEKIRALNLKSDIEEKLLKEADRLAKQPFGSSEGTVLRNYLDMCLELPWNNSTDDTLDVDAVRKTLEADHFGLEKVKERILEYIAVRQRNPGMKGQIICLVGPPGVGKTSIGISVARSLNRKLARVSLGGVHEIGRAHV